MLDKQNFHRRGFEIPAIDDISLKESLEVRPSLLTLVEETYEHEYLPEIYKEEYHLGHRFAKDYQNVVKGLLKEHGYCEKSFAYPLVIFHDDEINRQLFVLTYVNDLGERQKGVFISDSGEDELEVVLSKMMGVFMVLSTVVHEEAI